MAEYKRLITYAYNYESGTKKNNVGHARVEVIGPELKVKFDLKIPSLSGKNLKLYFYKRIRGGMQTVFLRDLLVQDGLVTDRISSSSQNVNDSGLNFEELHGFILFYNNSKCIVADWKDTALSKEELACIENPIAKWVQKEGMKPVVEEAASNIGVRNETELKMHEEVELDEAKPEVMKEDELTKTKPEIMKEDELTRTEPEIMKEDELTRTEPEVVKEDELTRTEPEVVKEDELTRTVPEVVKEDELTRTEAEVIKEDELEDAESDFMEAAQLKTKESKETYEEEEQEDLQDLEEYARKNVEVTSLGKSNEKKESKFLWRDAPAASHILNSFPRVYPFEDGEIAECVKIEPKDIGLLPMEAWGIGNNSFLIHAYCNYHHLLFAKKQTRGGCLYLLMVPGVYSPREKYMARMFGFEYFKCAKRRNLRDGEFGYWYVNINFEV